MPAPQFPVKPLLVYAALGPGTLEALLAVRPTAVMVSFDVLRTPKRREWWESVREVILNDWKPLIYIDSGAYTLMRRAGLVRVDRVMATSKQGLSYDETRTVQAMFAGYMDFLHDRAGDFDYIVEMDVDPIAGVETALEFRKEMRRIVGAKLLPVWHPEQGDGSWERLCRNYPYVALGLGGNLAGRETLHRLHVAARYNAKVHGLGVGNLKTLSKVPFDTVDSASWVRSTAYGWFPIGSYELGGKGMLSREVAKAHRFEAILKPLGYTIEDLEGTGSKRFEVAIRMYEMMMEEFRRTTHSAAATSIPSLFDKGAP